MDDKVKLGNQNPTKSVILPYDISISQEAIDIYQKTGLDCYEWQRNMLEPIMATNEDGLWVHQNLATLSRGVTVVRRKSSTCSNCGR